MRRKMRFAWIAGLALAVICLTACSPAGKDREKTAEEQVSGAAVQASEPAEPDSRQDAESVESSAKPVVELPSNTDLPELEIPDAAESSGTAASAGEPAKENAGTESPAQNAGTAAPSEPASQPADNSGSQPGSGSGSQAGPASQPGTNTEPQQDPNPEAGAEPHEPGASITADGDILLPELP